MRNMLLYYFYQSVLAVVIYILWIMISPVPYHEGAVTPFYVVVMTSVQFVIGTLFYFMVKPVNRKKPLPMLSIYLLWYLLVYAGLFNKLIVNITSAANLGIIHRGYVASAIIAAIITYLYYQYNSNLKTTRQ